MKKLLLIATTALLVSSVQAEVQCKKDGRYWYPNDVKSKRIAKMLGVKTCNGRRFKKVLKGLGEKSNVIPGKKSMTVADAIAKMK